MSHKLIVAGAVAGLVGLAAGAVRGQDCLWTQRAVSGPSARYEHAMAYDAARARVVLFGGREQFPLTGVFADTWEWDGSAWLQRQVTGPSARWGHAMAYDVDSQRIVLFGGRGIAGLLGDTWEWDGSAWAQRINGPPARAGHAMAFD